MSTTRPGIRLPAAERRQAIVDAALRVFADRQLQRRDDGGHRPGGGCLRADPLPPFRARSGSSTWRASTRPGCRSAAALDAKLDELGDVRRGEAVGQASREFHASGGIKPVTLGSRRSTRPARTRRSGATSAVSSERCTTTSPPRSVARRLQAAFPPTVTRTPRRGSSSARAPASLLRRPPRRPARPGRLRGDGRPAPPLAHRHRASRAARHAATRRSSRERSDPLGVLARTGICSRRSRFCLRPEKRNRPRLRLRGRSVRQAATGRHSERRDSAAQSRHCGCGGRLLGGAPLHTSLASVGASWPAL